jgi:hypothetical protein
LEDSFLAVPLHLSEPADTGGSAGIPLIPDFVYPVDGAVPGFVEKGETLMKAAVRSVLLLVAEGAAKDADKADEKAAAAELEAARKNTDEPRTRLAESNLERTRKELKQAEALLTWKEKEAGLAKSVLELAWERLSK